MLPKAFQEELVFWYYDTHKHAEEERKQAENALELLWERFNTDRLPVPLRHTLRSLYEQRRALRVAGAEKTKLEEAIKKQKDVVNRLRETYQ